MLLVLCPDFLPLHFNVSVPRPPSLFCNPFCSTFTSTYTLLCLKWLLFVHELKNYFLWNISQGLLSFIHVRDLRFFYLGKNKWSSNAVDALVHHPDLPFRTEVLILLTTGCVSYWWLTAECLTWHCPPLKRSTLPKVRYPS